MQRFTTVSKNFEDEGSFITKAELIRFIEEFDQDSAENVTVIEFDTDEGTSRDVTEDIAREMVDQLEWQYEGQSTDIYCTDICPFIYENAFDYVHDAYADFIREAA